MPQSPEKNREYLRERYATQRTLFYEFLGGACVECGTSEDLTIDHRDPEAKSFAVGRLWAERDLPKVFRELEKCQLLCVSCHIKKSTREQQHETGWSHGTMYGWMKKKCQCERCSQAKIVWSEERNASRRIPGGYGPRPARR